MGKKAKVVFDTNVWLSIFIKKILSDEFSKVRQDKTVYVSKDIILEMSKVLLYPKIAEILKKQPCVIITENIAYLCKNDKYSVANRLFIKNVK